MREYATLSDFEVSNTGNLTDDVIRWATDEPSRPLFARREGEQWINVSAQTFRSQMNDVAKGLIAAGIEHGDRVALLSKTRYEWTLFDYAMWSVGAVTVPIYETSSAEQVEWILKDSGAKAVVVETEEHQARVTQVRSQTPDLHHMWSLAHGALDVLSRLGADISDAEANERRTTVRPDDVATLIYTSGTTGKPKGCTLTHANFEYELRGAIAQLPELFVGDATTLLFLPLAHVFARVIEVGCVKAGARVGHSHDIRQLVSDFAQFQPTFVLAVPRVFEKIFNTASQRAVADGRGRIFDRAVEVAMDYSRGLESGKISPLVRAQHAIFNKLVYGKLRAALGGRCNYVLSGGAPLGDRLGHFYRGIGVSVFEGYGLTETTAAVTVNTSTAQKIGTVGRPMPGVKVRVADDGELLFRGGQVFAGYWDNPSATAEAIDDQGWFHTGDLGEIDHEGFVRITGRKKEILVTAGGKNVAPAVLEDRLRAHYLIDQCLVVGDGQPFIAALVTLDPEPLHAWAERNGKADLLAAHGIEALVDDANVRAEVQAAVDQANLAVSKAESIRKFAIVPSEWSEAGGQLTPSLKLKRNVVMREMHEDIEALYR
ncbi:MAG: AMP-dependent synthetase/ligase [Marmoricola sp.]